jgi:hypothetical protein
MPQEGSPLHAPLAVPSQGFETIRVRPRRVAAIYVDRMLKGTNPGELPVQQPTKCELVITVKAVRALGLEVPMALMLRADEMIE